MSNMKVATLRIDEAKLKMLDQIANELDRSRAWIINEAINQYLKHEQWLIEEIDKGLKDIAEGNTTPHEEVLAMWEKKLED